MSNDPDRKRPWIAPLVAVGMVLLFGLTLALLEARDSQCWKYDGTERETYLYGKPGCEAGSARRD